MNPVDVTISSFTYFILPNINVVPTLTDQQEGTGLTNIASVEIQYMYTHEPNSQTTYGGVDNRQNQGTFVTIYTGYAVEEGFER